MENRFYLVFLLYAIIIIATLVPSSTQLAIDSVPSTFSLTDNKKLIDSFIYPILNSSQLEVISKEANQTAIDTETKFDWGGLGSTQTCHPSFGNSGFNVCLFNSTGNVVTNFVSAVTNSLWSVTNAAFLAAKCYCRHDCSPPQIVCKNAVMLQLLGFQTNIPNQIAQLIFVAEQWSVFCYCPNLVPVGTNPCAMPAKPQVCGPE